MSVESQSGDKAMAGMIDWKRLLRRLRPLDPGRITTQDIEDGRRITAEMVRDMPDDRLEQTLQAINGHLFWMEVDGVGFRPSPWRERDLRRFSRAHALFNEESLRRDSLREYPDDLPVRLTEKGNPAQAADPLEEARRLARERSEVRENDREIDIPW